jgi:hypothetical protein
MQVSTNNLRRQQRRAFSMVEIALSIAVVAFALVAILGVLPTGMTVQKDNRDDNIINQEGRYWLEAIRSGSKGLEDITNYVEAVTVTNLSNSKKSITFENPRDGLRPIDIIALLSTPKFPSNNETNRVSARVKALTGPAAEKGPLTNEFSFRYELQVEITPNRMGALDNDPVRQAQAFALLQTLHEIRLTLRWPVVQRGNGWFVGNNRKTFRARVAGKYDREANATVQVATKFRNATERELGVIVPNRFDVASN